MKGNFLGLVGLLAACASAPAPFTQRTVGPCIEVCESDRIADDGTKALDCIYDCDGDGKADRIVFNPSVHPYCREHRRYDLGLCRLGEYTWSGADAKLGFARERVQK